MRVPCSRVPNALFQAIKRACKWWLERYCWRVPFSLGQVQRCKSKRCVFSKGDLEGRLSLSVYVCVCLSVFLPYMFVTCRYILMSACQGSNHLGDKHLGMPVRVFPERVYLRREDQPWWWTPRFVSFARAEYAFNPRAISPALAFPFSGILVFIG